MVQFPKGATKFKLLQLDKALTSDSMTPIFLNQCMLTMKDFYKALFPTASSLEMIKAQRTETQIIRRGKGDAPHPVLN